MGIIIKLLKLNSTMISFLPYVAGIINHFSVNMYTVSQKMHKL